jgi:uncharacterized protein YcbX
MAHVAELHVYPVHGEAGHALEEVQVEADGLAGDRRKKAPVHVVELDVTGSPSNCPGVYASVRRPGTVRVGDMVAQAQEDPATSAREPG